MPFTDRVPYYGLVDWDLVQITAYACELAEQHRPRRRWLVGREHCVTCGSSWPCFAAQWALGVKDTT